jgi:cyanophycinase
MSRRPEGTLMIIGGHERDGDEAVLKEMVRRMHLRKDRRLLLMTVASREPEDTIKEYRRIFKNLGVEDIEVLDIRAREDAFNEENIRKCQGNPTLFFIGGDQLRITSQLGDSPIYRCIQANFVSGGMIVGTSAGAAVMPATMLVSGVGEDSSEMSAIGMAPGFGLIDGVVIDTHFAERGRIGRLLSAVAQNPRNLGIGIDEDTAIIVKGDKEFKVIGSGAVYVVDGTELAYSSLSEKRAEGVISIYNVKLHVLAEGNTYDLQTRQPVMPEELPEGNGHVKG